MSSMEVVRAPSTVIASLPTTGDQTMWTDQERALVEAAGLVRVVNKNTGEKVLAERPVVEAFLAHCRRTALDPIARQIYCIYRGGKWQTQVSIDGARLVAERSGEYEGQTDPEWSDDGRTWFDAWVTTDESEAHPRFARIGVYRRGFREPLRVVARWESYAVYQDEWKNNAKTGNQILSAMWAKMPDLMLAKVAEMLALRKAFPQDLSGLYSAEEMAQADSTPRTGGAFQHAHAATDYALQPGAVPVQTESAPIAAPVVTRDWTAEASAVSDIAELTGLANEADQAGVLGVKLPDGRLVMEMLKGRKSELESPRLVDSVEKPKKRQWVREAKALDTRDEVRALYMEAQAAKQSADVMEQIAAFEATLPDPDAEAPAGGGEWAAAVEETEWAEQADGSWAEQSAGQSMALDDGEVQP